LKLYYTIYILATSKTVFRVAISCFVRQQLLCVNPTQLTPLNFISRRNYYHQNAHIKQKLKCNAPMHSDPKTPLAQNLFAIRVFPAYWYARDEWRRKL